MKLKNKRIQVAVVDDHTLIRKALAQLISSFDNYEVIFEVENGKEVKRNIAKHLVPQIILLDVNMPGMDGYETLKWLHENYPHIKVLVLSMFSDEKTIIRMLRLGANGYILKNIEPEELLIALGSVIQKDYYLSEYISGKVIRGLHNKADEPEEERVSLTEKEKEFLTLICSDLSYKEIANRMFLSIRSLEDYRTTLYEKLKVKSRVSLAIYAIKNGLVD